MKLNIVYYLFFIFSVFATCSFSEEPQVKYKAGKTVDFEQLLIQGELKRPEISVVTGASEKGDEGLLRLRENFVDRLSADSGEEVK